MKSFIPIEHIERRIHLLRGRKVMLDRQLSELYDVSVKELNQAVKRNIKRFPSDFMFQLTWEEAVRLRSQNVTLKRGEHFRYQPYAFTEQGVAMLSSVLKSDRAVGVNIEIMRAFVKLREMLSSHRRLAQKLRELEGRIDGHDGDIQNVFDAIRGLMTPPAKPPRKIGFMP